MLLGKNPQLRSRKKCGDNARIENRRPKKRKFQKDMGFLAWSDIWKVRNDDVYKEIIKMAIKMSWVTF